MDSNSFSNSCEKIEVPEKLHPPPAYFRVSHPPQSSLESAIHPTPHASPSASASSREAWTLRIHRTLLEYSIMCEAFEDYESTTLCTSSVVTDVTLGRIGRKKEISS